MYDTTTPGDTEYTGNCPTAQDDTTTKEHATKYIEQETKKKEHGSGGHTKGCIWYLVHKLSIV